MSNITDAELTKIQNALIAIREALLAVDQSPEGENIKIKIMKMIVESEQIVLAKLGLGKGDSFETAPTGGAAATCSQARIIESTKGLFEMSPYPNLT